MSGRPGWRALPWAPAILCVWLTGCGYVADPRPPLLNIPQRITDLSLLQRGDRLVLAFTVPRLTTEGVVLKPPARLELRIGLAPNPFEPQRWAEAARVFNVPALDPGSSHEIPAAEWTGKEIVAAMKAYGSNGRDAGWSNFAVFSVIPPLARPENLLAEAVPQGVRLRWNSPAGNSRIFRRAGAGQGFAEIAQVSGPEWTDTAVEYSRDYGYRVQAQEGGAVSELSAEVHITPVDIFPPAVPAGLTAIPSGASIELAWEPSSEPDLAGYRIYRGSGEGPLERLAESQASPSFSDRGILAGQSYRYAVSAVDRSGNESGPSANVSAAAP